MIHHRSLEEAMSDDGNDSSRQSNDKSLLSFEKENVVFFTAGISDGQRKPGVEQGAHFLLLSLKKALLEEGICKDFIHHETIDFTELMAVRHQEHMNMMQKLETIADVNSSEEVAKADTESFVSLHRPWSVGFANWVIRERIISEATSSQLVVTLGGDHSIAIGSIAATIKRHPGARVVWVDAHADYHTPASTPSGNIHGCPVGFLSQLPCTYIPGFKWLSRGEWLEEHEREASLTTPIIDRKSLLSGLTYYGLRSVEQEEIEHIEQHHGPCRAFWMKDIEARSIGTCLGEDRDDDDEAQDTPVHLSFDIDALDPSIACATGTPVPGGLNMDQALAIVKHYAPRLVSIDLVEVNPCIGTHLDIKQTVEAAVLILKTAIGLWKKAKEAK